MEPCAARSGRRQATGPATAPACGGRRQATGPATAPACGGRRQATGLVAIALALSMVPLLALTAAAKHRPPPKLIKQEPQFDTSFIPPRFELRVKHTDIIYPEDPQRLLHGAAKAVALRPQVQGTALQPRVDDASLRAGTNDTTLHGKVSDTKLSGGVNETAPRSPLNTLEHGVRPRFQIDLKKLVANIAPDLQYQMESEIAAAHRRVSDVEPRVRLMENEVRTAKPRPNMPGTPASVKVNVTKSLQSEMQNSVQNAQAGVRDVAEKLKAALANAAGGIKVPGISGSGNVAKVTMPHAGPSGNSRSDVSRAEDQLAGELQSAKHQAPSVDQLNAQLEAAKKRSQTAVSYAKPAMDIVLTSVRAVPSTKMPSEPSQDVHADLSATIEWDKWHARFAKLAGGPILQAVGKLTNPAGSNTVEITVSRAHRVAARIAKPSGNVAFDQAILKAYQSLDGNKGLEYPAGSKRDSVTFLVDNEHKGAVVPSAVQSKSALGDKELVRY